MPIPLIRFGFESGITLTVSACSHSHISGTPNLPQNHILSVQGGLHGHVGQGINLSQTHILTNQDAIHSHISTSPTLVLFLTLAPQNCFNSTTSQNIILDVTIQIGTHNAFHGISSPNIALAQAHFLQVNNIIHTTDSTNAALDYGLEVSHSFSSVHSPNLNITVSFITNPAIHGVFSENLILTEISTLSIHNIIHSHITPNIMLHPVLIVNDGVHDHSNNHFNLFQRHSLSTSGCVHSHFTSPITFSNYIQPDMSVILCDSSSFIKIEETLFGIPIKYMECDICGFRFKPSQLIRNNGLLVCKKDYDKEDRYATVR